MKKKRNLLEIFQKTIQEQEQLNKIDWISFFLALICSFFVFKQLKKRITDYLFSTENEASLIMASVLNNQNFFLIG